MKKQKTLGFDIIRCKKCKELVSETKAIKGYHPECYTPAMIEDLELKRGMEKRKDVHSIVES